MIRYEKQKMYVLYTNASVCWLFVTARELARYEFIYVLCILNLINFIFSHEKIQLMKRHHMSSNLVQPLSLKSPVILLYLKNNT